MSNTRKTAVITGASSGIGLGLAEAFLAKGYNVVGGARSNERLQAAAAKLNAGSRFVGVAGDVGSADAAKDLISTAIEKFGQIDVLVNNAGIFAAKPFTDFTPEEVELQLATNVKSVIFVTQQAAKHMIARKQGHIINITASAGIQPMSNVPALMAVLAKGGVNQATRGLALELAPHGITVNAVAPGIVDTPMHSPETHGFLNSLAPLGRIAKVSEIADAVLYLASADFVTGVVLPVDGGAAAGK